jgi:hypothetical protein
MKFTDKEFDQSIKDGLFNSNNEVVANPSRVVKYFEKWSEKVHMFSVPGHHKEYDLSSEFDLQVFMDNVDFMDHKELTKVTKEFAKHIHRKSQGR